MDKWLLVAQRKQNYEIAKSILTKKFLGMGFSRSQDVRPGLLQNPIGIVSYIWGL